MIKKPSKIHGFGIFTDRPIIKGSVFYQIPVSKISLKPRKRWAKIGDKYICDTEILNWINHSCEPNCKIDINKCSLIALRNINSTEEITCDYCRTEVNGTSVICNCGSNKCRGFFLREE